MKYTFLWGFMWLLSCSTQPEPITPEGEFVHGVGEPIFLEKLREDLPDLAMPMYLTADPDSQPDWKPVSEFSSEVILSPEIIGGTPERIYALYKIMAESFTAILYHIYFQESDPEDFYELSAKTVLVLYHKKDGSILDHLTLAHRENGATGQSRFNALNEIIHLLSTEMERIEMTSTVYSIENGIIEEKESDTRYFNADQQGYKQSVRYRDSLLK